MSMDRHVLLIFIFLAASGCSCSTPDTGQDAGEPVSRADGGLPEGCQGTPLTTDGVLDLDLKMVTITGAVHLNGGALPSEAGSRGSVIFTEKKTGSSASVPLRTSGPINYALSLAPGIYDVSFAANAVLCAGASTPQMPCTGGPLLKDVSLTADGALDVDIRSVSVSGNVTLNGQALPAQSSSRGRLSFGIKGGSAATTRDFGSSGTFRYAMTLLAGSYEVSYLPSGACDGKSSPAMPCNGGVVSTIVLSSSGALDVDLQAIKVNGAITVNGAALPSTASARGQMSFALESGTEAAFSLRSSGAVTYALTLLAGSYDIRFLGNAALCDGTTAPGMPCNGGSLRKIALTSSGTLDLDIPMVKVSGSVTVDGSPVPSAAAERGRISFALEQGVPLSLAMRSSGAVRYAVSLLPGQYLVRLDANVQLCDGTTAPPVPCVSGDLLASTITADGNLDIDIHRIEVSGRVTLKGQPIPAQPGSRGRLLFSLDGGGQAFAPLGNSGDAHYLLALLPGKYVVGYEANPGLCGGSAPPAVPCNGGALTTAEITSNGALDVDIPAIQVSGRVTLRGQVLPASTAERGPLNFVRSDGTAAAKLGSSGEANYKLTLIPGNYAVIHLPSPQQCDGVKASALPCTGQVLIGCD